MHLRTDPALAAYVWLRCSIVTLDHASSRDEAGEGVISTAIAVMVMAALGALMWVGFKQLWTNASSQTAEQISQIGQ